MPQYRWSNAEKSCFLIEESGGHCVAVDELHPLWGTIPSSLIQAFIQPPVYVPTVEDARATMRLSFAQLLIGLVAEGWITQAEGTAWLVARTPPGPVTALINQLPADQQFPALVRAVAPSEVLRLDPLVVGLGSYTGKTPEQIDSFFQTYSVV